MIEKKETGGLVSLSKMTLKDINKLVKNKTLGLDDCWNGAPTAREFRDFIKKHPKFTAYGDLIEGTFIITGIECKNPTKKDIVDFANCFHAADEFTVTEKICFCWYD